MERRVHYDSFIKGYLKRRAANSPLDQSIYSLNIYSRIEKAGQGIWFSWGGDTRMGDRIFGQRQVATSQAPASHPLFFGDGYNYSYIVCKQHVYAITGIVAGVQQISLSKDFSGITVGGDHVQIVDAISYNGSLYVATGVLKAGVPDPSQPQIIWVWDMTTTNTNWTNPPTPLAQVTFPGEAQTTLAAPVATTDTTMTVGSTAGMPGGAGGPVAANFQLTLTNEIFTVHYNSATVLNIITRGVFGSPNSAHQTGEIALYNPALTVAGTAGQIRWQYWIITSLAGQDSVPSSTQTILTGAPTLTATNYNSITFNAIPGQTYTIYRSYAGGSPNSVGIIAIYTAGSGGAANFTDNGSSITFTDTGLVVSSLHYQITPQFAIGDIGRAIAFVVIRNQLWRAAGAKMWAWDGQQATWSGESIIGDPNTNITGLDVYQDGLIIFKQDGVYTLNRTGDVFPLFPGFRTLGLNPRPIGQWQGMYFFASDVGMIWQWDSTTVTSVGFDYAEAYPFPDGTFGLPNAVTRGIQLPNFLLVGFNKYNSNNNAAFFLAYDGVGWHPFHYDPNYQASGLGMTGGIVNNSNTTLNPTIQFGKAAWNAPGNPSYAVSILTSPTLDPYLIKNYDTTPQTIFLPVDSGIISDEWKVLEGLRIFVENPNVGIVRMAYSVDANIFTQVYVDMGVPQGDRTTLQTFMPSGQLPVYRKIMFKVTLTPDANIATPVIRMIMHRYKQRESQRKSWKMQLFLEEGQMMPNRNTQRSTSKTMLHNLNTARKNRNLVEFKDIVGDEYWVYVESVGESLKTYRNRDNLTSFVADVVLVETAEVSLE